MTKTLLFPLNFQPMEKEFFAKLNSELHLALSYEDPLAQEEARQVVPVEKLEKNARHKCEDDEADFRDFLLVELVSWFKNDFFTWFDSPTCDFCQRDMKNNGLGTPTSQEKADGASRVEV